MIVLKDLMAKSITYQNNFYGQPIDSDIKWHEEIRKQATGESEDYTAGCLLDYEYIKNRYRIIAVDLRRQKELGANAKEIQQREFVSN